MDGDRVNVLLITGRETTTQTVLGQLKATASTGELVADWLVDFPDVSAALPGIRTGAFEVVLLDNGPGECFQQPLNDLLAVASHLPVIVLAASWDEDTTLLALSLGAQECVSLDGLGDRCLVQAMYRARTRQRAQAARNSDSLLEKAINAFPHPLYIIDVANYSVVIGNKAAGYEREKGSINCYMLTHDKTVPCSGLEHGCPLPQVLATGSPHATRQMHTDSSGQVRVVEVQGYPILDEQGQVAQMVEYVLDITDRLDAEERDTLRVEEQTRLAAMVFHNTTEGIIITDPSGEIVSVNRAFSKITGYSAEEAIGKRPNLLKSGRHNEKFYASMWAALNGAGQWRGEIWNRRKDGDIYPEWLTISAVKNDQGEVINYMAIFIDISQRVQNEELLRYLATHDPLTDVPNRELFKNRLRRAIARAHRSQQKIAVLMLDLDGFKTINDQLGHAAGDIALQKWAKRLKGSVRESDTVARLGGDEFSIILEGISARDDAMTVVKKILNSNQEPYALNGSLARLTASIGITLFPDDGEVLEELMEKADRAMYVAKAKGKDGYTFYGEAH